MSTRKSTDGRPEDSRTVPGTHAFSGQRRSQERTEIDPDEGRGVEPDVAPLGPVATAARRVILIGVLPVFSTLYLWQALSIAVPDRALAVSPRSFPVILGALMCLVSLVIALVEARRLLAIRAARASGRAVPPELDEDRERITSWRDAWVTMGALVAYVALFTLLGFFVATAVFLVALSTWFAPRRIVRNVIVSAVFSYAVYLLFVNVLNVSLPEGILAGVI